MTVTSAKPQFNTWIARIKSGKRNPSKLPRNTRPIVDHFFKGNKNLIKKDMLKKIPLQKSKRIQVLQLHLIKIKTMIVPVVLLLNLWTFITQISTRSTRMRVSFRCGDDKKSKFYCLYHENFFFFVLNDIYHLHTWVDNVIQVGTEGITLNVYTNLYKSV